MMGGCESDQDRKKLKVTELLWNMTVDDESDQDGLEQNGSQHNNTLCNLIGFNKSDCGKYEVN